MGSGLSVAGKLAALLNADVCWRCQACMAACPLVGVLPHYAGPKRLGPDLWRLQQASSDLRAKAAMSPDLDLCLGCRRCDVACPAGVEPARLIALNRLSFSHRHHQSTVVRDWFLGHPTWLGRLGTTFSRVANPLLGQAPTRALLHYIAGISGERRLPPFAPVRFSKLYPAASPLEVAGKRSPAEKHAVEQSVERPAGQGEGEPARQPVARVLFFPGCQVEYYEPDLGERVVAALRGLGVEVAVDEPSCCGLPAIANAWPAVARRLAERNVERLAAWVEQGFDVVLASSSCGLTIRTDYTGLGLVRETLAEKARLVAEHVFDLGEYLLQLERRISRATGRRVRIIPEPGGEIGSETLAYHTPCHTVARGDGRPWLELLRRLPGRRVLDLQAGCCGIAGTYGLKREKYSVSREVGEGLRFALVAAGTPPVATECETCRLQIRDLVPGATVAHPLVLLGRLRWEERAGDPAGGE